MDNAFFETVEQMLDEDNLDPIVLKNPAGKDEEYEQIALVPLAEEEFYAILLPLEAIGNGDETPLVFYINDENESFDLVTDRAILQRVFMNYCEAMDEILEVFVDE